MLTERRLIVFLRHDLLDAMRHHGERIGKAVPYTPPDRVLFDPLQDKALVLRFGTSGKVHEVVFSREEVKAGLEQYFTDRKGPVPADAELRVEKYKDGAALMVQSSVAGLHVMLIDDQETVRSILRRLLGKADVGQFTEADDGEKALEMVNRPDFDPDIIICDMHMEKMDGIEFLRRLRAGKNAINSRKPVVILTGDKADKVRTAALQAGASAVLTKPIAADALQHAIAQVLGYVEIEAK